MASKDCTCSTKKRKTFLWANPRESSTLSSSSTDTKKKEDSTLTQSPSTLQPQPELQSHPEDKADDTQSQTSPNYIPLPYSFKAPSASTNGALMRTVRSPPFWLQVDHAVAVIWCLFSPQQAQHPLGITQLQWALEFLKGIRSRRGDHPKDVQICIQAIEDRLIEQYAGMGQVINQTDSYCGMTNCETCNQQMDSPNPITRSRIRIEHLKDEQEAKLVIADSDHPLTTSSTTEVGPNDPQAEQHISPFIQEKPESTHKCKGAKKPSAAFVQTPVSVTYEAMLQRSTPVGAHAAASSKQPSYGLSESLANSDLPYAIESALPAEGTVSKGDMLFVLKQFRREQVDRIQNELKKLHSIEKYMNSMDKDGFEPYIEEKVAEHLQEMDKGELPTDLAKDTSLQRGELPLDSEGIQPVTFSLSNVPVIGSMLKTVYSYIFGS